MSLIKNQGNFGFAKFKIAEKIIASEIHHFVVFRKSQKKLSQIKRKNDRQMKQITFHNYKYSSKI